MLAGPAGINLAEFDNKITNNFFAVMFVCLHSLFFTTIQLILYLISEQRYSCSALLHKKVSSRAPPPIDNYDRPITLSSYLNPYPDLGKPYLWDEYLPPPTATRQHGANDLDEQIDREIHPKGLLASSLVGQPVYVSMTTISSRIGASKGPLRTIRDIYSGTVIPDRIYLFVSRDKYMIDEGISEVDIPKGMSNYIE